MMDLVALRTFLAVVDCGGVSRAAKELHTVQSNVTARIKRLEEELGQVLFHRVGRGLQLSASGRVLQRYAREWIALERQTKNAMLQAGQQMGEVCLGCMESFAAMHLPGVLSAVKRAQPTVSFQVSSDTSGELIAQVRAHKLDFAIVGGPVEATDLHVETLLEETLVRVQPKACATRGTLPLIVFREGCVYRHKALHWQEVHGQPGQSLMEFGTLDGILGCVAAGLGQTLMPERVVRESRFGDNIVTEHIDPQFSRVPTVLVRYAHAEELMMLNVLRRAVAERVAAEHADAVA